MSSRMPTNPMQVRGGVVSHFEADRELDYHIAIASGMPMLRYTLRCISRITQPREYSQYVHVEFCVRKLTGLAEDCDEDPSTFIQFAMDSVTKNYSVSPFDNGRLLASVNADRLAMALYPANVLPLYNSYTDRYYAMWVEDGNMYLHKYKDGEGTYEFYSDEAIPISMEDALEIYMSCAYSDEEAELNTLFDNLKLTNNEFFQRSIEENVKVLQKSL